MRFFKFSKKKEEEPSGGMASPVMEAPPGAQEQEEDLENLIEPGKGKKIGGKLVILVVGAAVLGGVGWFALSGGFLSLPFLGKTKPAVTFEKKAPAGPNPFLSKVGPVAGPGGNVLPDSASARPAMPGQAKDQPVSPVGSPSGESPFPKPGATPLAASPSGTGEQPSPKGEGEPRPQAGLLPAGPEAHGPDTSKVGEPKGAPGSADAGGGGDKTAQASGSSMKGMLSGLPGQAAWNPGDLRAAPAGADQNIEQYKRMLLQRMTQEFMALSGASDLPSRLSPSQMMSFDDFQEFKRYSEAAKLILSLQSDLVQKRADVLDKLFGIYKQLNETFEEHQGAEMDKVMKQIGEISGTYPGASNVPPPSGGKAIPHGELHVGQQSDLRGMILVVEKDRILRRDGKFVRVGENFGGGFVLKKIDLGSGVVVFANGKTVRNVSI